MEFEDQTAFAYDYWSGFSGTEDRPENYSVIKFRLAAHNGQTTLQLKHSNFANPAMYEHSDKNWEETLDVIKKLAEQQE